MLAGGLIMARFRQQPDGESFGGLSGWHLYFSLRWGRLLAVKECHARNVYLFGIWVNIWLFC